MIEVVIDLLIRVIRPDSVLSFRLLGRYERELAACLLARSRAVAFTNSALSFELFNQSAKENEHAQWLLETADPKPFFTKPWKQNNRCGATQSGKYIPYHGGSTRYSLTRCFFGNQSAGALSDSEFLAAYVVIEQLNTAIYGAIANHFPERFNDTAAWIYLDEKQHAQSLANQLAEIAGESEAIALIQKWRWQLRKAIALLCWQLLSGQFNQEEYFAQCR